MSSPLSSAAAGASGAARLAIREDCDIEEFEPLDSSRNRLMEVDFHDEENEEDDDMTTNFMMGTEKDSILFYSTAERT